LIGVFIAISLNKKEDYSALFSVAKPIQFLPDVVPAEQPQQFHLPSQIPSENPVP